MAEIEEEGEFFAFKAESVCPELNPLNHRSLLGWIEVEAEVKKEVLAAFAIVFGKPFSVADLVKNDWLAMEIDFQRSRVLIGAKIQGYRC